MTTIEYRYASEDQDGNPGTVVYAVPAGVEVTSEADASNNTDAVWWELLWEPADTDEPGDQNADSSTRLLPGSTSAYYSLGPTDDGKWSLELIQVCQGEEIGAQSFGHFDSEKSAKERAETWEAANTCERCGVQNVPDGEFDPDCGLCDDCSDYNAGRVVL